MLLLFQAFLKCNMGCHLKLHQIGSLIKVSILDATHSESGTTPGDTHAGIATANAETTRICAANRTAPIDAYGPDIEQSTRLVDILVPRQGQF